MTSSQTYQGQEPNNVITTQYTSKAVRKGGFFIGTSSMIKISSLALAILAGLFSPAFAAGTISLSLMQQFGTDNKPLNGGKLYFFAAGTTTPQNAFQDSGLTLPWPNPITLDSTGRVPQLFFADGNIKVRLTNSAGVTQLAADNLLVVGPSSGGGGGGTVDPTTILQTGDPIWRMKVGVVTGFVRMNGRTIGSATSGATERANADTAALYDYLWQNMQDFVCPVTGGRGVSSAADFAANKPIGLPDMRGKAPFGVDDMGNSAANVIPGAVVSGGSTILPGSYGGVINHSIVRSELPPIALNVTGRIVSVSSVASFLQGGTSTYPASSPGPTIQVLNGATFGSNVVTDTNVSGGSVTLSTEIFGSSTPFTMFSPFRLGTWYLKL